MTRQAMLALVVFTLALVGRAAATVVAVNSFENGLGSWAHAGDPESATAFVSGATVVSAAAHEGQTSVVLNADGAGPGGSTWLISTAQVEPGPHRITISFWINTCNDSGAASAEMIAAATSDRLDRASQFTNLGRPRSTSEWQHFQTSATVNVGSGRTLRVAIGLHRTIATNVKLNFDDVSVSVEPASCKADIDHSGSLTTEDVFAFLDRWFAGRPECDFDASGRIETLDIFAFLNAWMAGCP